MNRTLKLVVVPIILALTVATLSTQAGCVENGQNTSNQEVFVALYGLFEKANFTVYNVLMVLEDRGVSVPNVVWNNYHKGLSTAIDTIQLRDEGKYAEAKEKILEAMHMMKAVLLSVAEDFEEVEMPEEREAREALGIEGAIERINATISKLNKIVVKAEGRGIDTSRIRERLGNLTQLLTKIKWHIDAGNISEAAEKMNMSQREFGETMKDLKPIIESYKANQSERFLSVMETRLLYITEMITEMVSSVIGGLPIPERVKEMVMGHITSAIEKAQDKIGEVKSHLQEGRTDEAVVKLQELGTDIKDIIAKVKEHIPDIGQAVGEALEEVDRHETALEVLEGRASILSERGVDTSALLSMIEEVRALIREAIENLKEGNFQALEDVLAQIRAKIDEAEELADRLEGGQ